MTAFLPESNSKTYNDTKESGTCNVLLTGDCGVELQCASLDGVKLLSVSYRESLKQQVSKVGKWRVAGIEMSKIPVDRLPFGADADMGKREDGLVPPGAYYVRSQYDKVISSVSRGSFHC